MTTVKNGEGSDAVSIEPLVARYQPACKPGSVRHRPLARTIRDGHSSGTMFAHGLEQPTRTAGLTSPRGVIACANSPLRRPYSVLLPVGFTMPAPLPEPRCALTAPFHPYLPTQLALLRHGRPEGLPRQSPEGASAGGSFSVALSLGLPPPDVIRHRMSREPGLSSPAAFRHLPERPSGRLTGYAWGICDGSVKQRSPRKPAANNLS
ncbi:hypothetical protein ABIB94_001328 [Bradyrhizobium sp. JR7.2]